MLMLQRKGIQLSVAYRATEAFSYRTNGPLTATCKSFLPVQVSCRLNDIQGKGIPND